jgi:hypothetical protein
MYETIPHNLTEREPEGELICSRCGMINPGEEDTCTTIYVAAAESMPEKKAA